MAPRTVFCMVFVPEAQTKNGTRKLAAHFWRLSLCNSYTLAEAMCARATSKGTGSRARGEGRERGNLVVTTAKPAVAQRAGGIFVISYLLPAILGQARAKTSSQYFVPLCIDR